MTAATTRVNSPSFGILLGCVLSYEAVRKSRDVEEIGNDGTFVEKMHRRRPSPDFAAGRPGRSAGARRQARGGGRPEEAQHRGTDGDRRHLGVAPRELDRKSTRLNSS